MKPLHLCGIIGLTLLLGLLSGCSLLLDDPAKQAQELEELSDTQWLIASQGEEEPQVCEEDLSRTEARREAKEALKEDEEVQQLKESLEALGKRLLTWRAQGCVAQTTEDDEPSSQGLWALSSEDEVSLVEIPAGRDAALYLAEQEQEGWQEGTFWITLKGSTEEGEELWVHGEVVPAEELGVLAQSEDELPLGWVSFVVPDEAGRLELAAQLFELVAEEAGLEGVSASSSEGEPLLPEVVEVEGVELAWDKMEVLILNDDGEEAEALIVVPALEDVSGERLWQGFGGFSRIDLGRALHFRVRVQRVEVGAPSNRHTRFRLVPSLPTIGEELWRRPVIKPRPRPPVVRPKPPVRKEVPNFRRPKIKPVVPKPKIGRWGSKFKSSFKFCPYRYYGKLSLFRKALCQRSWQRWYTKQWQKGRVANDFLKLYNSVASREGLWGLVGYRPRHGSRDRVLILGGFRNLSREQLRELWEKAADMPLFLEIGTVEGYQPRDLERAVAILSSLDPDLLKQWLIQLARSVEEGNFSTVYQQLLQHPDFLKFQEVILLALPEGSPEEYAKQVLEVLARAIAKSSDGEMAARISHEPELMAYLLTVTYPILNIVKDRIIEIRQACIESEKCDPDITPEKFAATMIDSIEWAAATVATVEELHFPGFATGWDPVFRIPRWNLAFVNTISFIIFDIYSLWKNEDYYTPRHAMDLLWGLFMTVNRIGPMNVREAREAVITILGVATFLRHGKERRGDPIGTGFPGAYWLKSILPGQATLWGLIPMKDGSRRGMYVELRWNDCINCSQKMDLIMAQLRELVAKLEAQGGGILGYMFTNRTAQPHDILLQSAYEFGNRNVALIITWWEGDHMKFTCIGLLCDQMSANQRRAMACMQAGLRPFCDVEEVTIGSSSSGSSHNQSQDPNDGQDDQDQNGQDQGIGLGPAPPPPLPCLTCPPQLY